MASIKWSFESTRHLINSIQRYECLYNNKCPDYSKRDVRSAAQAELADEISNTFNVNCDAKAIAKKWNALRNQYMEERKKVDFSRRSGDLEHTYQPSIYWFNDMEFMHSNILDESPSNKDGNEEHRAGSDSTLEGEVTEEICKPRKKRKRVENMEEVLNGASQTLAALSTGLQTPSYSSLDEFDTFGLFLAGELRELSALDKGVSRTVKSKIQKIVINAFDAFTDEYYCSK